MKSVESIFEKEQRELAKWKKEKQKPIGKHYSIMLIIIIAVVYLLDALSSDLHSGLQDLEFTYFSKQLGITYDSVASTFAIAGLITIVINIISPFYKALADKLGRKALFIMSTAGMGMGLLLGAFSTNLLVYWIGRILLTFFICADIQVVYIMEVAPAEKRGRLFAITKFISQISILIIPACRDLLLNQDGSNWQVVCIVPAIIAALATISIILFVRESDPFMDKRIQYLEIPYEERLVLEQKAKTEKITNGNSAGIGNAFKYAFSSKQIRSILLVSVFISLGFNAFVGYNTTIWLKGGMDLDGRNAALYAFPIMAAFVTLAIGFISDKLGRKVAILICGGLALFALIGFTATASPSILPYITGALYGICYGAFWSTSDITGMLMVESVKTQIRASVQAVSGLILMVVILISSIIFAIAIGVTGESFVTFCVIFGAITMGIALLILMFKVKETKGIDISKAGEEEYL